MAEEEKLEPLNDRQELFCREYVIDFNGTKAAIRAGYSEGSAASISCENLIKPNTSGKYDSGVLSLMAGTATLSLLFMPLIGFKRNRKAGLIVSLIFCLFYLGCKKETKQSETSGFKIIKVEPVNISGQVIGDAAIKSF